ncbi:MAG: hypothetical protein ACI9G1_001071 [Pirellulaceae bacterium]|jgi:hypothetical protein
MVSSKQNGIKKIATSITLVMLMTLGCSLLGRVSFADYTAEGLIAVEWWIDSADDIYLVDVILGARKNRPAQLKLNRILKSTSGNEQLPGTNSISSEFNGTMVRGDQLLVFARLGAKKKVKSPLTIARVLQITGPDDKAELIVVSKHGKYFRRAELAIEYVEQRVKQQYPTSARSLFRKIDSFAGSAVLSSGPIRGIIVRWIDIEVDRSDGYFYIVAPADADLRKDTLAAVGEGKSAHITTLNSLFSYPGEDTEAVLEAMQSHSKDWVRKKAASVLQLLREKSR